MRKITLFSIALFILLSSTNSFAREVTIYTTGDIMMHIPVKNCAARHNTRDKTGRSINNAGFDFLFKEIAPVISSSDISMGNLEFPVAHPYESQKIIFNCPPQVLPALKKAGFTMLMLANNHILDQEEQGLIETIDQTLNHGFDIIGVHKSRLLARGGVIKDFGSVKIGFLGYTGIMNYPVPSKKKGYHINWFYNRARVIEDIQAIREKADFIILSVHTGKEYETQPQKQDSTLMKEYCDAGVDCIIGHHPHVLQPVEEYRAPDSRECVIFYSLGNLISNQTFDAPLDNLGLKINTADSIIVEIKIKKRLFSEKIKARYRITPVFTRHSLNRSTGLKEIQVMPVQKAISEMKKKLSSSPDSEKDIIDSEIKRLYIKIKAMRLVLFSGKKLHKVRICD